MHHRWQVKLGHPQRPEDAEVTPTDGPRSPGIEDVFLVQMDSTSIYLTWCHSSPGSFGGLLMSCTWFLRLQMWWPEGFLLLVTDVATWYQPCDYMTGTPQSCLFPVRVIGAEMYCDSSQPIRVFPRTNLLTLLEKWHFRRFIDCNKCTIWTYNVDSRKGFLLGTQRIYRNTLYFPFNLAVNLTL